MNKITAYVDKEIWNQFKKMVIANTDDSRAVSKELQKLIESSLPERTTTKALKDLYLLPDTLPSIHDVKQVIPKCTTFAGKTFGNMRYKASTRLTR